VTNFIKLGLLLLPLVLLGGCAGKEDVQMVQAHYDAMAVHEGQQTLQVSQKANAISSMVAVPCNDNSAACGMAKAMSAVVGAMMIKDIEARDFDQPMPRTGIDSQVAFMEMVSRGIPMATIGIVSYKAIAEDRGTVNVSGDNGAVVSNSYEEHHATNFGDKAQTTNQPGQTFAAPEEEEEIVEEATEGVE
jgi:hypothetical protein